LARSPGILGKFVKVDLIGFVQQKADPREFLEKSVVGRLCNSIPCIPDNDIAERINATLDFLIMNNFVAGADIQFVVPL